MWFGPYTVWVKATVPVVSRSGVQDMGLALRSRGRLTVPGMESGGHSHGSWGPRGPVKEREPLQGSPGAHRMHRALTQGPQVHSPCLLDLYSLKHCGPSLSPCAGGWGHRVLRVTEDPRFYTTGNLFECRKSV